MNETIPKISVICPVYKAESYLRRCVDSILAQTFEDFELILVDDGSPDRSGEICDEYAAKDSRVKVIHQENGGVTCARRKGVEEAKGEWINFVDSDDTLLVEALQTLLDLSDDTGIVVGWVSGDKRMNNFSDTITAEEYRRGLIKEEISASPCAKLIRHNLFNFSSLDIPREIVNGEDLLMNIRIAFCNEKSVRMCKKAIYNYTKNESSRVHTFKLTLDYCQYFFIEKGKSIPYDRRCECIRYNIKHKLRYLSKVLACNNYQIDLSHVFIADLKNEIKSIGYRTNFYEKRMLSYTLPFALATICLSRRVWHKVRNLIHIDRA